MKYISFAIPCYNSEAYMEKAINSILVGGEDVEIIVVNDGSKDGTQEIAERYQEKYPTIVKAVAKPNGGHGDAVNCGLEHATGKYFKVVDSDDWVDEEALLKVLDTVKGFVKDYWSGICEGVRDCHKCRKVSFTGKNLPHYLKIQLELWGNNPDSHILDFYAFINS